MLLPFIQIYFAVIALDMLGALDEVDKDRVIAYVYSLQIAEGAGRSAGFIGSGYLGFPSCHHCDCGSDASPCAYTCADKSRNHAVELLEVRWLYSSGIIPFPDLFSNRCACWPPFFTGSRGYDLYRNSRTSDTRR